VDATVGRGRPKNYTWKTDLEKEMWTAGYKYSWRKIEAAAQNRVEDANEWVPWPMLHWERQGLSLVSQVTASLLCSILVIFPYLNFKCQARF